MTLFWQRWLFLWAVAVILFGAVLAGAALPRTDGAARALFALLDGPGEPIWNAHLRFATGLLGAVSMGWGLTFLYAFRAAAMLGDQAPPIWRGLTMAALAWYAIDSALSAETGFALNALSNTVLLVAFLIPILRSGVLKAA